MRRFPGNCLVVALVAVALGRGRLCSIRNRTGRLHFFWRDRRGRAWEFYTAGASRRSYLRNAFTWGEIRLVPSLSIR